MRINVYADDAVNDLIAERKRQVNAEGWTTDHDDAHYRGELATAAAAYAISAANSINVWGPGVPGDDPLDFWPWGAESWKPSSPRRDLVKAGALILAEIERIDRAEAREA